MHLAPKTRRSPLVQLCKKKKNEEMENLSRIGRGRNLQRILEEVEKFLKFKFCLDRCTLLDCVATKKGRAL